MKSISTLTSMAFCLARSFCTFLVLVCVLFIPTCSGFANNLVTSRSGCMTELDTTEVIMNYAVKSAEESDFGKMHLAVLQEDTTNQYMESPFYYHPQPQGGDVTVTIAFVNPYSKEEFSEDLQFAIQVEGPAAFLQGDGAVGCEGNRRASGRLLDGGKFHLKIEDPSAKLRIWAGWATGHEAVRLTPNLLLEPANSGAAITSNQNKDDGTNSQQMQQESHRDHAAVLDHAKGEQKTQEVPKESEKDGERHEEKPDHDSHAFQEKRKQSIADKVVEEIARRTQKFHVDNKEGFMALANKFHQARRIIGGDHNVESEDGIGELKPLDGRADIHKSLQHVLSELDRRKSLEDEMQRNFPDNSLSGFRARYNSDSFAGGLHMSGYFYGCAFFICSMGLLLFNLSRRREKGRRDL